MISVEVGEQARCSGCHPRSCLVSELEVGLSAGTAKEIQPNCCAGATRTDDENPLVVHFRKSARQLRTRSR